MSVKEFTIKKETHPAHLNAVRLSTRAFQAISQIAHSSSVSQNEVVRQMIDFALEHHPMFNGSKPEAPDGEGEK